MDYPPKVDGLGPDGKFSWDAFHRQKRAEGEWEYQKIRERGCFTGTTPVLTPDGWKPIAELGKGDQVISYDKLSGTTIIRRVKGRKDYKSTRIWEVCLTCGKEPICTTISHSFLTNRGWKRTSQLRNGDTLVSIGGEEIVVAAIVKTNRVESVYNLLTEGEHTFVVQGCIVHNFTYLRNVRTWWHKYILSSEPWAQVSESV